LGGVVVVQSLPTIATLNSSLYVVYAGYQDYFFSLYDSSLTPQETLQLVDPVVQAIVDLIEVRTSQSFSSMIFQGEKLLTKIY